MFRHEPRVAEQPLHAWIERGAFRMFVVGIAAWVACAALIWAGVLPAAFWRPLLLRVSLLVVGVPSVVSAVAAVCEPGQFRFIRATARLVHVALLVCVLGTGPGPDAPLRQMTILAAFVGLAGIGLVGDVVHLAGTRTAPREHIIGFGAFGVGIVLSAAGGLAAANLVQWWGWLVWGGILVAVAGLVELVRGR